MKARRSNSALWLSGWSSSRYSHFLSSRPGLYDEYQIGTAESDGQFIIKGGSVETDGTLGPLSASNIVSMSVDIGYLSFVGGPGGFEQLDGSTTLNLTNSTLKIRDSSRRLRRAFGLSKPPGWEKAMQCRLLESRAAVSLGVPVILTWVARIRWRYRLLKCNHRIRATGWRSPRRSPSLGSDRSGST